MISIKSLASSSAGNCYRIDDGNTALLLEAGITIKRIKEGLNFRLSEVQGCLLSHEHGDHSKAIKDILKAGIDVYTSEGTARALAIQDHHRCKVITAGRIFKIRSWKIMPFEAIHDAAEPLGFYLVGADEEALVFLTDSAYCKALFPSINYMMIECNYSETAIRSRVMSGQLHPGQHKRILFNHFGLENIIKMLKENDLSKLKEIHLLHLSNDNSDASEIRRRIAGVAGVPVYIENQ